MKLKKKFVSKANKNNNIISLVLGWGSAIKNSYSNKEKTVSSSTSIPSSQLHKFLNFQKCFSKKVIFQIYN